MFYFLIQSIYLITFITSLYFNGVFDFNTRRKKYKHDAFIYYPTDFLCKATPPLPTCKGNVAGSVSEVAQAMCAQPVRYGETKA